jgi:hypothetical protein
VAIKASELAERWGVSRARISQMVSDGMPLDSSEAAEAWRSSRKGAMAWQAKKEAVSTTQDVSVVGIATEASKTQRPAIEESVEKQKLIVQIARQQYIQAVQNKDPRQGQYYASYDKTLGTLLKLEDKALQRAIATKKFVDKEAAAEQYSKVLVSVRKVIDDMEFDLAARANPENPAKALKAIREWKLSAFRKISQLESGEEHQEEPKQEEATDDTNGEPTA